MFTWPESIAESYAYGIIIMSIEDNDNDKYINLIRDILLSIVDVLGEDLLNHFADELEKSYSCAGEAGEPNPGDE